MPAWTETDDFQLHIGGATENTSVTNGDLDAAEALVIARLGYDPSEGTASPLTRYFTTDGTDALNIGVNVTGITNVWVDAGGAFGVPSDSFDATATLLTSGTEYVLENENGKITGILRRIGAVWPLSAIRPPGRLSWEQAPCHGCVKVTFTKKVGPNAAIVKATYHLAAAIHSANKNGMGTVNSESLDGASYSITPLPISADSIVMLSPTADLMLRPFIRWHIARM